MSSLTIPNKDWMRLTDRSSMEYINGVGSFIEYAKACFPGRDLFSCPCVDCKNAKGMKAVDIIVHHLIVKGILQSYTRWYFHGEPLQNFDENIRAPETTHDSQPGDVPARLVDLVNDVLGHIPAENLDACMDEFVHQDGQSEDHNVEAQNDEREETLYMKLKQDATQLLYPSSQKEHTKLSVTVELMSLKANYQWSDNSFGELLRFLKKILPPENTLPETMYAVKKMINGLGMKYEPISVCPNECMLYWKEHEGLDKCHKCGVSRWNEKYADKRDPVHNINRKRVPAKVLRYFPLMPRLKRLYSVPWIANAMTWHKQAKVNLDIMRHPVDSPTWKLLNHKYPDFCSESRNVYLGLATDGFNPFGNSNSYSCWPVMLVPYNLPPSMCMRREFIMLSLLIPGRKSPGNKIDVYLQPLISELNDLWRIGTSTFDAHTRTTFVMKACLLWCMHDYPAYGHLSGCRTSGKYACPPCGEMIDSMRLKYGRKHAYMGHRRFLPKDHPFRKQRAQFNNKEENRDPPSRLSGVFVLKEMEKIQVQQGKKRKRAKKEREKIDCELTAWSRRSILFDLPYWKDFYVPHNLDVMHIEKNVCDILVSTLLDTNKTKDGLQARKDLKLMKIRKKFWPRKEGGSWKFLKAPFTLTKSEKELFFQMLHNLKAPIGYSSNWKHNIDIKELQFRSIKSHDYHILMQQLLPILLRHTLKKQKPLVDAIRRLSIFFNILCSKVISRTELKKAHDHVVEALCVFEKYFPPSFFVSMIHLIVHLKEEAMFSGPVRYRWMYPFECMLRTYKGYVKNPTYVEGCIAERYIIKESLLYCMEYMPNGREGSHRRGQQIVIDDSDEPTNEEPLDKGKSYTLANVQFEQARRWVLHSSEDVTEWEEKYETYLQSTTVQRERPLEFVNWLRHQLQDKDGEEFYTIKRLADGPSFEAISYKGYRANGFEFYTQESEENKSTQNSGVSTKAMCNYRASKKDKNLKEDYTTFFGVVKQILELDYFTFKQTVFYCDWVRDEDRSKGYVVDKLSNTRLVNLKNLKSRLKKEDEPFILPSTASQVFYLKDPSMEDGWCCILDAPKKLTREVDAYDDPFTFEIQNEAEALMSSIMQEVVDDEDEIDE